MSELAQFIVNCTTILTPASEQQPDADLVFFALQVSLDADAKELHRLLAKHEGVFSRMDPQDGAEHSYIEIGGWLGSQELALRLMGLGAHLKLWKLLTPPLLFGASVDKGLALKLAESGLVSIVKPHSHVSADREKDRTF